MRKDRYKDLGSAIGEVIFIFWKETAKLTLGSIQKLYDSIKS